LNRPHEFYPKPAASERPERMSRRHKPTPPPAASGPAPPLDGVSTLATPVKLADVLAPLLSQDDLARVLNASRRTVERMRAGGKLPRPDLYVGKMPRWRPETVRRWIDEQAQGRGGR
jgi:hypothetical protein